MARDAVAEVDAPGQGGRGAVGVVGDAGEEASDAPGGDAESKRNGVEIAGGLAEPDVAFGEFDGDEAEGKGSDDGLAADEVAGVVEAMPGKCGVFEPEQKLGAEGRSGNSSGDDGPADRGGDGISETPAKTQIDAEGDQVGKGFEKKMWVNGVAAEMKIDRESDRGMKSEVDEGL